MNVVFYFILLGGVGIYAVARGGPPERVVAAMIIAASLVDFGLAQLIERVLSQREYSILAFDLLLTIGVIAVALNAERLWPMLVSAFLIVGLELQVGIWLAPEHHRQVYKIAHAFSAYPVLFLLTIGIWRRARRAKRGCDRAWTRFPHENESWAAIIRRTKFDI